MRILNSCVVSQVQTVNSACPQSQPYTYSARLLLDKRFVQPDVFAVVNCPVLALSVFHSTVLKSSQQPYIFAVVNYSNIALRLFYSTVLMRCRISLQL